MKDELKSLIEDAAKLLGLEVVDWFGSHFTAVDAEGTLVGFNPLDPERGDLMKVAMAARLDIEFDLCELVAKHYDDAWGKEVAVDYQEWDEGDYQSLALAILRAASAVLHSRGGV